VKGGEREKGRGGVPAVGGVACECVCVCFCVLIISRGGVENPLKVNCALLMKCRTRKQRKGKRKAGEGVVFVWVFTFVHRGHGLKQWPPHNIMDGKGLMLNSLMVYIRGGMLLNGIHQN